MTTIDNNIIDALHSDSSSNDDDENCTVVKVCSDGILLPVWYPPVADIPMWARAGRATVYFISLLYLFLGVSIIADRFMTSIEVITSHEREVIITRPNGEMVTVRVRTWNETVSNLTLMALGSSAPEIMLSVIEVIGHDFKAGDLGPGTIVGSAAFNLFVIIGICVAVIPDGEVRRIKHLRVFIITASWSVFAYLWLYLIIALSSPEEVEVWEGIVTFLFFPATVLTAHIADKKIFLNRFLKTKYHASIAGHGLSAVGGEYVELGSGEALTEDGELKEFEKTRKEYIEILREMRKRHPDVDMRTLEGMSAIDGQYTFKKFSKISRRFLLSFFTVGVTFKAPNFVCSLSSFLSHTQFALVTGSLRFTSSPALPSSLGLCSLSIQGAQ